MRFAHNSERQFADLLDFYAIAWEYEPRTFVLERDAEGNPQQAFTPDFYLPAYDLFIEITTLNQKLVTKKNRKARRLEALYGVKVRVLYQRGLPATAREVRTRAAVAARGRWQRWGCARFVGAASRASGWRWRNHRHRGERMTDLRHSPLDAAHRGWRAHGALRGLGDADPVHRRARGAPRVS